jgi:intracellular sulfur oxidation DsrE/DsrF family protein
MRPVLLLSLLLIAFSLHGTAVVADESDKPFAEAHIVLQVADGDAETQARALSVANNLIKHYGGPDFVDIEIVAYGPGLSLLYPDNPNRDRISSLVSNAVRFAGCLNTVETIERTTGKKPELIPATIPVQTGVARLVELAQQGYVIIRP